MYLLHLRVSKRLYYHIEKVDFNIILIFFKLPYSECEGCKEEVKPTTVLE
jgi:hypothetical protein